MEPFLARSLQQRLRLLDIPFALEVLRPVLEPRTRAVVGRLGETSIRAQGHRFAIHHQLERLDDALVIERRLVHARRERLEPEAGGALDADTVVVLVDLRDAVRELRDDVDIAGLQRVEPRALVGE